MPTQHIKILDFGYLLLMERDLHKEMNTYSRVVRQQSLCSARLRSSYYVIRDMMLQLQY